MNEVLSRGEDLHPTVKVTDTKFASKAFSAEMQEHQYKPEIIAKAIKEKIWSRIQKPQLEDAFIRELTTKYKWDINAMAKAYEIPITYSKSNLLDPKFSTVELKGEITAERYQKYKANMDSELMNKFGWDIKKMLQHHKNIVYPWSTDLILDVTMKDLYFREKIGVGFQEWLKAMRTWEEISALKTQVQVAREARIASTAARTAVKVAKKIF